MNGWIDGWMTVDDIVRLIEAPANSILPRARAARVLWTTVETGAQTPNGRKGLDPGSTEHESVGSTPETSPYSSKCSR